MSIESIAHLGKARAPWKASMAGLCLTLLSGAVLAEPAPQREALSATPAAPVDLVHLGLMPCALKQEIRVQADAASPGQFTLQLKGQTAVHRMQLVPSVSGAVRLENVQSGLVWLQLSNKSMLMNQKLGRRLADECMSPLQQAVAESHKTQPPPSIFDVAVTPR